MRDLPIVLTRGRVVALIAAVRRQLEDDIVEATMLVGQLRHRVSVLADLEAACDRDHRPLVERNGALQATNVQLAHQLEQTELRLEEAEADGDRWARQLRAIGVEPLRAPEMTS